MAIETIVMDALLTVRSLAVVMDSFRLGWRLAMTATRATLTNAEMIVRCPSVVMGWSSRVRPVMMATETTLTPAETTVHQPDAEMGWSNRVRPVTTVTPTTPMGV